MKYALLLVIFISGCATAPMAPTHQDKEAKKFTSTPDKAALYIVRNESIGGRFSLAIQINGLYVSALIPHTFAVFNLTPGKYYIESRGENTVQMPIILEAGKNHFIWQEVKMGWHAAQTDLHLLNEAEGQKATLECEMVRNWVLDSELKPIGM